MTAEEKLKEPRSYLCPLCKRKCDEDSNENYIYVSYNYWRGWDGDSDDGSWVKPVKLLLCSDCSQKRCDYLGESHLRDHPSLWAFKTRKKKADTDLTKYIKGMFEVLSQGGIPEKRGLSRAFKIMSC